MEGQPKFITTDKGINVRNIRRIKSKPPSSRGFSYIFEAEVDGNWIKFGPFCCGDWSSENAVRGHGLGRTVKVGFWEVKSAWDKHPEVRDQTEEPVLNVQGLGELLESDARRRAINMARSIAEKIERGDLVLDTDLGFLTALATALNGS